MILNHKLKVTNLNRFFCNNKFHNKINNVLQINFMNYTHMIILLDVEL